MCPLVTDRRRVATTQFLAERKLTAAPQDLNTQDLSIDQPRRARLADPVPGGWGRSAAG
jgi:hypothetical protein